MTAAIPLPPAQSHLGTVINTLILDARHQPGKNYKMQLRGGLMLIARYRLRELTFAISRMDCCPSATEWQTCIERMSERNRPPADTVPDIKVNDVGWYYMGATWKVSD
jgi:hypothetical protein